MATITRVLLAADGPFHFGKRGVGLNETEVVLPADALFSALCHALQMAEGTAALETLLAAFPKYAKPDNARPPFRLTSLMPSIWVQPEAPKAQSPQTIDLLPMPLLRPKFTNADGIALRKQMKEITWVSRAIFQKLAQGQNLAEDEEAVERQGERRIPYTVQEGAVWLSRTEFDWVGGEKCLLWKVDTRPRVTVDRISTAATAFSSGGVYFINRPKLKVSLYALLRWEAAAATQKALVKQAFAVLGESGIGGERSYGYGQFRPEFAEIADDLGAAQGDYFTILAPYLPQPTERAVFAEPARYTIILRRGWLSVPGYTQLRRPTVRMVDTGAILHQLSGQRVVGALADATPELLKQTAPLTIHRYGLAWPVPIAAAALTDNQGSEQHA
ncbi:MAG: hypothetical protein U0350_38310 [Caldilineaceae bacterium]